VKFLEPYLVAIETELEKLPLPKNPRNLYEPCKYMLSLGGKRIRPALTLLAHDLFGKSAISPMNAALCVELFHNFSLIHDDIMDKAPLRRGKPTVHVKWNETTGILSGDVMLVHSYKLLSGYYKGVMLEQLMNVYNKTATEVCEGQQLDMDFEKRTDVTVEEYVNMISLKTSVLLGCALQMGAITANAPNEQANHLYEFGKNLGIAFQLRDDYLDAFGDPEKTGKQPGGDILAGKKTFLVIEASQRASTVHRNELWEALNGNGKDKLQHILGLLKHYGMEERVQHEVVHYQQTAMQHLDAVEVSDIQKKPLRELANYLLNREH